MKTQLDQELTFQKLLVKGAIPLWLEGTLIRNTPVMFEVNGKEAAHWFDGLAMLHAFAFEKGSVSYSNRFIKSTAYHRVVEEGKIDYLGFATDPCSSVFKRLFAYFHPLMGERIKNANVNVTKMAGHYVALTEIPLPVCFDVKTLETLGVFHYEDDLPKGVSFQSAHPHYDAKQRELISYLVKFGRKSTYEIYRMKEGSSSRELIASMPVEEPSYMHSFAMTENFVILVEFPLLVKPLDFLIKSVPFIKNYRWKPEKGCRFTVVERQSGQIKASFQSEAFFAFHHANAYEEGDEIVMDIIAYPDASSIGALAKYSTVDHLFRKPLPANSSLLGMLRRFRLSLTGRTINETLVFDQPLELPKLNEGLDGKRYQFLYAVDPQLAGATQRGGKIYKIDVQTGFHQEWIEEGCQPSEPIFAPSPNALEEDEGLILAVVLNDEKKHSFLLILDAKTFEEIARAEVPHCIPLGFHGSYFEDEKKSE